MGRNAAPALALAGVLMLAVAVCAPASAGSTGSIAPSPTDPFYQPPSGYASTAPGTILRSRPVLLAAFGVLPEPVRAWQLLYRSTDWQGDPMATVTTVLLPTGGTPKGLLSYQIAEDASAARCAPSHALLLGGDLGEVVNQAELVAIDAAVAQGFAVSVPDYEGPDSEWGAARQPGYAILDGLRAAQRFAPLGLPGPATPTGLWGYSGGSLALLATAGSQCEVANLAGHALINMSDYLTVSFNDFLALPAVTAAFDQLDLGGTTPTAPIYVYHAVHDELVPIAGADATVRDYCAHGDSVSYVRHEVGEHASVMLTGMPAALDWLTNRLAGGPAPVGCTTTTAIAAPAPK